MRRAGPLLALALACATAKTPQPGPSAAEAGISSREALDDVRWLAAPERTGRGVGTAGNAEAARFVAERFRALGLEPAYAGGFEQPLDAPVRATLGPATALALAGAPLELGRDFQPFTFSDDGRVEGELVWAGYGITAPALGWDDYAGVDVKGKVVVVAAHVPREGDPASPFHDPKEFQYGEWRYKVANARDHGAAALLAVSDDWHHEGGEAAALPAWRGAPSSRAGLVAVAVAPGALQRAGADPRALAAPSEEHRRPHPGPLGIAARLAVEIHREQARTSNVVALLPGTGVASGGRDRSGPDRSSEECVVVGAHYDHLGLGGEASLAPGSVGAVHPGADDNASGVAALLQLAKAFVAAGPSPRTIVLAAFTGEELGLLGSSAFVRSPPARCPLEQLQLMVNLDMVGRAQGAGGPRVYVEGAASAKGLRERVAAIAREAPATPLALVWGRGDGFGPSDHTSFHARGVPVLFLFTGAHADYHRPSDTPDKVDADGLAAIARLTFRVARDAAAAPARLEVVRAAGPAPAPGHGSGEHGYGAYLGTVPDFAERKEPGVLVSAVRAGSPAERAGIAAGDVLLQVGATKVVGLRDLTTALRTHRPGETVDVSFLHGAAARTVKVTLEERR